MLGKRDIANLSAVVLVAICLVPNEAMAGYAIGETAPSPAAGGITCGGSWCTFFQMTDAGSPTYAVSTPGVITKYYVRTGTLFGGVNKFRLRVFRPLGGNQWRLIGESPDTSLLGIADASEVLPARVSVQTGDLLGIRVNLAGNSQWEWATGSASDVRASLPGDPSVGETINGVSMIVNTNRRVNVQAVVEPDADGDGYGDQTQDLCPGDPTRGGRGCSGDLIGSSFLNPFWGVTACVTPGCIFINGPLADSTTTATTNGVIVRWRFVSDGSTHQLRLLRPEPGGVLRAVASSAPETAASAPITTGLTRIPVKTGDKIGMSAAGSGGFAVWLRTDLAPARIEPGITDGDAAIPSAVGTDKEFLFNADIEADRDGDGHGDETQDGCPTEADVQGACPPPAISGMRLDPKRFRVNRSGGVTSRARKGSTIRLGLSRASSVRFVIERRLSGRRKGKTCSRPTRRNRGGRRCIYYSPVHSFSQSLAAGANTLSYSGMYLKKGKPRAVPAGSFRLNATPTSTASGIPGGAASARFSVARR